MTTISKFAYEILLTFLNVTNINEVFDYEDNKNSFT